MRARCVSRSIRSRVRHARGSDAVNSSTFTPVYLTNDASDRYAHVTVRITIRRRKLMATDYHVALIVVAEHCRDVTITSVSFSTYRAASTSGFRYSFFLLTTCAGRTRVIVCARDDGLSARESMSKCTALCNN